MAGRFEEFIDIDKFKKALQYAAQATGIAFSVLDPLGNTIIKPINEAEFCIAARQNKAVCDKCVDCIVHSAIAAAKSKRTHFSSANTAFWSLSCLFLSTANTFPQYAEAKCAPIFAIALTTYIRKKSLTKI